MISIGLTSYSLVIYDAEHLYIVFGEVPVQIFWPVFNWLVCFLLVHFRSSLCILEITQLSDMSFANVFIQFMVCLFILLTESAFNRAEQEW